MSSTDCKSDVQYGQSKYDDIQARPLHPSAYGNRTSTIGRTCVAAVDYTQQHRRERARTRVHGVANDVAVLTQSCATRRATASRSD